MEDLSFYNAEGTTLRKAQMIMLQILITFDAICKKNNIPYWLSGGTLLGAKRHKGFIPWDDDLDVEVLQSDYQRLLSVLERELPSDMRLQTKKTDKNYIFEFAKIRDTKSYFAEDQNEKHHFRYNGIFIDIFPVEACLSLCLKHKFDRIRIRYTNRKFSKNFFGRCFNTAIGALLPLYYLYKYTARFLCKLLKIKRYSLSPGIFFYNTRNIDKVFPLKTIEFEGHRFNCPYDTDAYLKSLYGEEYMIAPPFEERLIHASKIEIYE